MLNKCARRKILLAALAAVPVLLISSVAWATQEHADPEGLYSHQLAHLFFMLSMVVLMVQLWMSRPLPAGWKYIGIAAFLFLLWNADTFAVHWLREILPPDEVRGYSSEWSAAIDLYTAREKALYAGKILDHFFLVGAIAFFLKGIMAFGRDVEAEERQ